MELYHSLLSYPAAEYTQTGEIVFVRYSILIVKREDPPGRLRPVNFCNLYKVHESDVSGIRNVLYHNDRTVCGIDIINIDKFKDFMLLHNSIDEPPIGIRYAKRSLIPYVLDRMNDYKKYLPDIKFIDPEVIVHSDHCDYRFNVNAQI